MNTKQRIKVVDGVEYELVFTMSAKKNGKVVRPRKAKVMCFWRPAR